MNADYLAMGVGTVLLIGAMVIVIVFRKKRDSSSTDNYSHISGKTRVKDETCNRYLQQCLASCPKTQKQETESCSDECMDQWKFCTGGSGKTRVKDEMCNRYLQQCLASCQN